MHIDTVKIQTEEHSILVKGLVDTLVELYPDAGCEDDERFFAVLMLAQRLATELRDHVHQANGTSPDVTPFSIIG